MTTVIIASRWIGKRGRVHGRWSAYLLARFAASKSRGGYGRCSFAIGQNTLRPAIAEQMDNAQVVLMQYWSRKSARSGVIFHPSPVIFYPGAEETKMGKRTNKYGARRTELSGRSFASKGEADCYLYLKALETAKEIHSLECQVTVRLGPNQRRWVLDFKYFDVKRGETVWADYKGYEPDRWKHLLDLWVLEGPGPLIVYKGRGLRMMVAETVIPKRTEEQDWE